MYTIYDYAYNGYLYLNNIIWPRHKRLSQLMIYSTTACQSRCKHCNIWQKRVEHLSLDDIKNIMASQCVSRHTTVGLEGGEFILHPQAAEIMAWFREHHPNYTLLSNCLAPRRVIDAVRLYQPRHLYVSLDGGRETYQRMRGRDGYDRVIQVVEALKDEVPLSLMFCLSPWNNFDDMAFVIDIAKQYGVDVRIGIYGTMAFFDTTSELLKASDFVKQIPQSIHQTQENFIHNPQKALLRLPNKAVNNMMTAKIQKSVGILPVTRPTLRGSGIALSVRTSNAEAHACMYKRSNTYMTSQ